MRLPAILFLLISCFFVKSARSQSNELLIQGQTGKLYLEHTVVAKENWFSVGRLYNANPKEIAVFNHLAMTQPLTIGENLQIPLGAGNFSQTGVKTAAETLVPVYHIIQDKEWLYRISVNHNKVPVPSLEKWNNINKDQARAGMHLIVGFLKVKTALSALAATAAAPATAVVTPAVSPSGTAPTGSTAKPSASTPVPSGSTSVPSGSTSVPSGSTSVPSTAATNPPAATVKPAVKPTAPVTTPSTVTNNPTTNNTTPASSGHPSAASFSSLTGDNPPARTTPAPVVSSPSTASPVLHFNGGFFKSDFSETGKTSSGQAGVFKSTSGWQDGKYYALMNNVPVGTIVKVSVAGTDKSVFAKVLGQLPDMKESAGLTIRISNAAASELGTGEHFSADLRY